MSNKKYLIFPWDGYKDAMHKFEKGWAEFLSRCLNYVHLDMDTRKYDYIQDGKRIGPKLVQSLEYVLTHWPKDRPRGVVVQAGGCLGLWPKILSETFGTVYTFEPQSEAFFFLSLNCPEKNIVRLQMALGEKHDLVSVDKTNRPGRGVVKSGGRIPVMPIDSLDLQFCDAILLDTEGYELNILLGAGKTIRKFRPIILCEDWEDQGVKELMDSFGYELICKVNKDNVYKHRETEWNA